MQARTGITINRPPQAVYDYFHDFSNLPTFMWHLESVEPVGHGRSHWIARAQAGTTVEWDAEIVEDKPAEIIAWRSIEGADVPNTGLVSFMAAPAGQGTEVRVELEYRPPGGPIGVVVAKLFGEEPGQQLQDDLRRFKQVLETGEVVLSDGSPEGLNSRRQLLQREAQPLSTQQGDATSGKGSH
jgi:uncharacterized membrane protein